MEHLGFSTSGWSPGVLHWLGRDTARGTIMGSSGQCSRSLPSGRITPEPPRPPCFQRLWPPPSLQSGIRSRPGRRGYCQGVTVTINHAYQIPIIWVLITATCHHSSRTVTFWYWTFYVHLPDPHLFQLTYMLLYSDLTFVFSCLRADSSVHAARWRWCVCRQPSLAWVFSWFHWSCFSSCYFFNAVLL